MGILYQSETEHRSYLGWYGQYGQHEENINLRQFPEIVSVFKFSSDGGTLNYSKNNTNDFLQSLIELEPGNPYYIILEPGLSSINLPHFNVSGVDNIKLVLEENDGTISQNINSELFTYQKKSEPVTLMGWYGAVGSAGCVDREYDLTQNKDISFAMYIDEGKVKTYYRDGLSFLKSFTKLQSGKCYYIGIDAGEGDVLINNFISSKSIEKLSNNQKFKIRQKTKIFVALWNFKSTFDMTSRFSDNEYNLGDFDESANPIKRKLKVSDIEKMLNQENYVYPVQPNNLNQITGSVSDYFKNVTNEQLDLEFKVLNLGSVKNTDDPDDYAYTVLERTKMTKSSELKKDLINTFRRARYQYMNENFPINFDSDFENFDRQTSFGIVIHSYDGSKIRARNLLIDPDANGVQRKVAICNVIDKSNSSRLEPIGVHVHELIHSFDLKDLYASELLGMSKIDTMGYGFWGHTELTTGKYYPFMPSSYTRSKIFKFFSGNIKINEINKTTKNIELKPATETDTLIKIKHPNFTDIWHIDYRTNVSNNVCINYDKELIERGLSIIHENTEKFDQRVATPEHKRAESGLSVSLEQQDGLYQLQTKNWKYIELNEEQIIDSKSDFFKSGDEFSPHSLPSTITYSGITTGIKVHNIRMTEINSVLFDVTFLKEPNHKIIDVNYYKNNISENSLLPRTCGNRPRCTPTEVSPFLLNINDIKSSSNFLKIEIVTENIPNGEKISLYYLKTEATEFTNPGYWATGEVNDNKAILEVSTNLIGLYFQPGKNHLVYKIDEGEYSDLFWYNDYVEVVN